MERISSLDRYQKGVLIFMAAMVLVFSVIYSVTIDREGFLYKDTILVPSQEPDATVYSGKILGKPAAFRVSGDKTVVFQYGDQTYGPYTAREDPTAVFPEDELAEFTTGIELYKGSELLFRGGMRENGDYRWLFDENGQLTGFRISATSANGMEVDEYGNEIDPMEPSVAVILDLMAGPALRHKGDWTPWLLGVVLCIFNAVSMLYADELFRRNLAFRVRDPEKAEPSDWEIAGRYLSWTFVSIAILVLFLTGLQ